MPATQGDGQGGGPSGVGNGGSMGCGGATPTEFPCPGNCNTIYPDGVLDPCLSQNCACYFNWENQNTAGEWNIIFPNEDLYSKYCSSVDPDLESCFTWGFDTQLKVLYEVDATLQTCGGSGGSIPQKGWQRLRYAPSYYTSQNAGEVGDKFWFPFPIYDENGLPLKRPDGTEYTTAVNGEVSACDCNRLMMFKDIDGLWKIKIDPAKGRIVENVSNHTQLVAYFALPNNVGTKGSDTHEHGFCIIDGIKDCDFASEDAYCHGAGTRWRSEDGFENFPDNTKKPQCLGEFGVKEYKGSVYFVDSAGVATFQREISEQDTKISTSPYSLPPYYFTLNENDNFWARMVRIDSVLYNNFGAVYFGVDANVESTLPYNPNSTVLAELTANSIELSKFYKTHCCTTGGSERIANILLSKDKQTWQGDDVLPNFGECDLNTNPTWWSATSWFLNQGQASTSITTQNLDSYKSASDQYSGFERKLQNSIENYLAYVRSGSAMEYLGGAFGCRGKCGRGLSCDVIESNIFDLVREKLCGSKTAKLIGFGGITLPEDSITPKYHVPDTRLAGNNLNDFTYYCTNLMIDPTTKFGSFGAVVTGSTLHRDNIILSNDYTQGRCMNLETPAGTILPYQDSKSGDVCSDYIATTETNQNDTRCYWYWTQRFDNSSGDQTIPTAMEYHWLSGGYFYGNKELRDNVYKELGTIHFNTSVNINNFANDITTQDKTPKDYSIKINTTTEYLDINNLWDIAQSHISVGFATSSSAAGGTGGVTVNGLTPVIKYNSAINGYFSTYSASSITQYVDTLSLIPSKFTAEIGTENTVKEDVNGIFVKLISSKTGLTTQWPKTDNSFTLLTPAQLSFLVDTGSGGSYRNTYYNVVNSPTTVSIIPSDTGTPVTTLQYFANNAIESSMAFITDAIPITTYENYKFFGSIIDKNTIEISTNTSDIIYSNTNTKVTTTSTTKFDYLIDIKTQWDTNPDAIGFLNLYNYTTNGTNQINIVLDSTTTVFDGATISNFQTIKDPVTGIVNRILITLNEDIPELLGFTYGFAYSRPFVIKLNSCYSGTTTNLNNQNKESVLTQNTSTNDLQFKPTSPIKPYRMDGSNYLADTEYPLFDLNSSKFSTPDYSFIKLSPVSEQSLNVEKIIPLRGAEYSTSEKQSYPTYRTVKKANGKYYLQILAGAFPYFHSVVHLPAIKGVSGNANQDGAVEESLKKVCSKNIDWYNHVATTKWTCLVKHTQFSQNLTDYKSLVNTKAVNVIGKPVIIGRPGPATINAGGSSGGRPVVTPTEIDLEIAE